MKKINKSKFLIIILLLIVSIGFAFLSARLDINGLANIRKINWNIYFDNVQKNFGEEFEVSGPTTSGTDTTSIRFEVVLEDPGDSYSFDVDVVNGGTIDAMYSATIDDSEIVANEELFNIDIRYKDGIELEENNFLAKNTRDTLTVTVTYNRDIAISDLPSDDCSKWYDLKLQYTQANINGNTAVERERIYTINYDLDGGVNNENNPSTYTNRSETFTLEEPTKEGYTFLGWTGGKNLVNFRNTNKTMSGVSFVVNNDKSITMNGTSTFNSSHAVGRTLYQFNSSTSDIGSDIFIKKNTDYYITGTVTDKYRVECQVHLIESNTNYYRSGRFSVAEDSYAGCYVAIEPNQQFENITVYPYMEQGKKFTGYEPYISDPQINLSIEKGSQGNRTYIANWQAN